MAHSRISTTAFCNRIRDGPNINYKADVNPREADDKAPVHFASEVLIRDVDLSLSIVARILLDHAADMDP